MNIIIVIEPKVIVHIRESVNSLCRDSTDTPIVRVHTKAFCLSVQKILGLLSIGSDRVPCIFAWGYPVYHSGNNLELLNQLNHIMNTDD